MTAFPGYDIHKIGQMPYEGFLDILEVSEMEAERIEKEMSTERQKSGDEPKKITSIQDLEGFFGTKIPARKKAE